MIERTFERWEGRPVSELGVTYPAGMSRPGGGTRPPRGPRGAVGRERSVGYAGAVHDTDVGHDAHTGAGDGGVEPGAGDGGVEPGAALAALRRAADLLARVDLDRLDGRDLLEFAVALDRQLTRVQGQHARALAQVDARGAFAEDACVTTASWWRWRTRRDHGQASRAVTTAARLRGLPATRAALERGDITLAHADVIASAATPRRRQAIADAEAVLARLAADATPRDVARACRHVADAVDADGSDATPTACGHEPDERRDVSLVRTVDGLGDLRATLDPVTCERLEGLLHAASAPDPAGTPERDRRTPGQRRHDALDAVLRAAQEHPRLPEVHGSRPHVLLTIDLMTLLGRDDLATRRPRLGSGTELPVGRALALLGKAGLTPVLMLGPWRAVAVGRRHRTLPPWLRPVLQMIHGHCRGPGCDRPIAWTDAAHLDAWHRGGQTALDRTIPDCRGHHKLMDVAGWAVELDPDTATCTWTSPDGRTVLRTHPPDP